VRREAPLDEPWFALEREPRPAKRKAARHNGRTAQFFRRDQRHMDDTDARCIAASVKSLHSLAQFEAK
jgi:hypothetical protein